ncbi:dTDP-4-dehydrorhamnose reductase [Olleya aquimaris]|uniref:dTDP-4-dehydrorhamnose reductase n=1 Tax=Olleya aquimaris TaxID=639310 RepID=A0A327RNL5_9FLAO|nr:dTDP-4-dehydrorhamnose reductase [Olleya aquimaris]RAJ17895.1 dTDP-4-dehydrorhamnose reductase [Olleya aquimaris]
MKKILVTGANGQLGLCLKEQSNDFNTLDFVFLDSQQLDITNPEQIELVFNIHKADYCINCAAYTAVDLAEDNKDLAYNINTLGAKQLAEACKKHKVTLIHISTDFVFDGNNSIPYKESDKTNPLGVYGFTKLEGEKEIITILKQHYIIRTSWLYSKYKSNFVKTMLNLSIDRDELNVVNDQKGTPTNALDLAEALIKIVKLDNSKYGIYHYSNLGEATWYEFAKTIFELTKTNIKVNPVTSDAFKTKAKRPKYSVMDKTKVSIAFKLNIPKWKSSLKTTLNSINY